jgi:hypothetical protein
LELDVALEPLFMEEIAKAIRNKKCVPFLGAAANMKYEGYAGLPLGMQVSEALADKLNTPIADKKNLPRVSLVFERKVFRSTLIDNLKTLIPDSGMQPSKVLTLLARLPFDLYVTTNYDRLLETALAPRNPVVVIQTVNSLEGAEEIATWAATPEEIRRPLVYKIHGSFKEAGADGFDRSPVIVTEDDYIEFLTLLRKPEHSILPLITSRLSTRTLLFLGYSLEDWDFRVVYRTLVSDDDEAFRPASYSVQLEPPSYWVNFWNHKKVNILNADVYDFSDELERRFPAIAGGV